MLNTISATKMCLNTFNVLTLIKCIEHYIFDLYNSFSCHFQNKYPSGFEFVCSVNREILSIHFNVYLLNYIHNSS